MDGDITGDQKRALGVPLPLTIKVPVVEGKAVEAEAEAQLGGIFLWSKTSHSNVTVARLLLESLGHQVTVGDDQKRRLSASNHKEYDLVLLDIQLPDMTGFDVAHYYRTHYQNCRRRRTDGQPVER